VASQSFDKDLARARAQEAMGWKVGLTFTDDRIRLTFEDAAGGKIEGLAITGELERTVTDKQDQDLTFAAMGSGVYSAPAVLTPGLWEVAVDARGADGKDYRKTYRFTVKGAGQ
jgi:nitrogen fixation protein FixH